MHKGRCDCGAVRFHFSSGISEFSACHCTQCRRLSGTYWAGFHVPDADLTFDADDGLAWYESSNWAKRGFCQKCGASLFYKLNDGDGFEVAPGCIEGKLGKKYGFHIFAADKGDYYDLSDGIPQFDSLPPS